VAFVIGEWDRQPGTRHISILLARAGYDRNLFGILITIVFLIVYGSFYPWVFEVRHLPASPLYILLHSWDANLDDRRLLFDVAVNIAIYIPLGMSAYLAFRRFKSRALEILAPVALGTLLSASVEMLQLFTPHRQCSAVDLVDNILGSAFGVLAGFVFTRIVDVPARGPSFRVRERSAVALLFCWVASLLFPLFPVLYLTIWRARLSAFVHAPLLSPIPILLCAAEWFAVGRLLLAAGTRSPFRWLLVLLCLMPAQFAIVNHNPMPADSVGAALAALLFYFFGGKPGMDRIAAIALLLALALRGLAPFHFEGASQPFGWIPFVGSLSAEWQDALPILLGKLFQYGASLWLLRRSGVQLLRAAGTVTLILAAIEALQTRIPGHVAEITDPLLAVLLYLGLRVLDERQTQAARQAAPRALTVEETSSTRGEW
jgi:VanZ family protein